MTSQKTAAEETSIKHEGVGTGRRAKQRTESPSIFLGPHPLTLSGLLFRVSAQVSYDSLRAFNDRIKIRVNRGL